ncbi:MAG TPA: chloride channel protein [Acidobacteriaceae bacterium]|nr:chloride channel protein [Acidobacteriaceae bacterium]
MSDAAPNLEPVNLPEPVVCVQRWTWGLAAAAAATGAVSAMAAALVRLSFRGLQWILTGVASDPPFAAVHLPLWRRALTPVLGALLAWLVLFARARRDRHMGREPRSYVEYVEAVRHGAGRIPWEPNLWRTLSAACSVASGAAVGREGSMIQFAAAVASRCGRWRDRLRVDAPGSLAFLVACGVAGGVTTAYNAPVAAVFFAAEIVLGGMQWKELPLLGLASGAGWWVSGLLLGRERLYPAHAALGWSWSVGLLPVLAIVCGFAGPAYQWLLSSTKGARRLPVAVAWGGAAVGLCSVVDPRVWGNGDAGLSAALGRAALPHVAVGSGPLLRLLGLRLLATSACVGTGTVGGVFTPTLFAGGALGALLGQWMHGDTTVLYAIAGMSCLMAATTHAPVMAACIAVELTGDWALLPVLLPLNFMVWWIARRLSPRAMYAIASQSPEQTASSPGAGVQTVQ